MDRLLRLPPPVIALLGTTVLALALVLTAALPQPVASSDPRLSLPPLQAPGEWFDSQRNVGLDASDYAGALAEAAEVGERTAAIAPAVADAEWQLLGPTNIGGRVVDLALIPGRPNEVYVATASGGVWRSTDAGTTYEPRWDPSLTSSLGAMAAGSDGTLYVGTGEANPGGGSVVYGGTGLYRSTDLGATWEFSGLATAGAFGRIAVDPTDASVVWAAASGNLFVPGNERGLYVSREGGAPGSWELALAPPNDTTGAVDVAIDPADPDRILVAMWDHYRTPDARVYAGPGSGVHLSEDGGQTWTQISEITLSDPLENGRMGVAFAPSDSSRAYAIIANRLDGTHGAWFSSSDGGRTFTESNPIGLAANNSSYGWWFARIFIDPLNADHMYVAGLELIESLDGGQRFVASSNTLAGVVTGVFHGNVHADQHAMVWSPDVPGLVYLGNDGGVYRSDANGAAGTWVSSVAQGWTQHYSVDVDEQTAEYVVSGLQDNLCQEHVGGNEASSAAWTKYGLCGDGIVTRVDPSDPSTTYYCSQYGNCGRAIAGAPDLRFSMPSDRYGWLADIQFDPNNSDIIYTGGSALWRSTNQGTRFTEFSGDLSSDPEQLDPNPGYRLRGVITTISAHPNSSTVWVGTDEGRLWVNHDILAAEEDLDNETWTLVDDGDPTTTIDNDGSLGLPQGTWITSVLADPNDPTGMTAYVAYSGFRQGDNDAKVFVTTDGGASFAPVGQGLPSAPVNDVIAIGSTIAVATDVGVFLRDADLGAWLRLGDLPSVPVIELRYHAGTNTLTAATFGHGVQRVALDGITGGASASPAPDLLASIGG